MTGDPGFRYKVSRGPFPGSRRTVFGVFDTLEAAERCAENVKAEQPNPSASVVITVVGAAL